MANVLLNVGDKVIFDNDASQNDYLTADADSQIDGYIGGVHSLWLKAGGLGIGKDAGTPLDIYHDSYCSFKMWCNSGDPRISFSIGNNLTDYKFSLGVDNSDSNKFKISGSGDLGTNDRLVIDSSGNVGIGTSSPSSLLHLASASNIDLNMLSTAIGGYSRLFFGTGTYGNRWNVGMRGDATHIGAFSIEGDETGSGAWGSRLFIKLDGNVGIGTTSPGYKLDVRSSEIRISDGTNRTVIRVIDETGVERRLGWHSVYGWQAL
jgi:hypothetical protein